MIAAARRASGAASSVTSATSAGTRSASDHHDGYANSSEPPVSADGGAEDEQAERQPHEPGQCCDKSLLGDERATDLPRSHPDGAEHAEVANALPGREEQRREQVDEPDEQEERGEAVDDGTEDLGLAGVVVHRVEPGRVQAGDRGSDARVGADVERCLHAERGHR